MMWNQTLHEAVTSPPLTLTADLLIGAGGHKKVYVRIPLREGSPLRSRR